MTATTTLRIETLQTDLKDIIARLRLGETITLVAPDGDPLAILVSLKKQAKPMSQPEWLAKWQSLVKEVDRKWQGDKSAIEILSEMRR